MQEQHFPKLAYLFSRGKINFTITLVLSKVNKNTYTLYFIRELFFANNHTFSRNCRPISQHFLITANKKILCSIVHFFAVLGAFLVQITRQLTPRKKHMNKMEGAENKKQEFFCGSH